MSKKIYIVASVSLVSDGLYGTLHDVDLFYDKENAIRFVNDDLAAHIVENPYATIAKETCDDNSSQVYEARMTDRNGEWQVIYKIFEKYV